MSEYTAVPRRPRDASGVFPLGNLPVQLIKESVAGLHIGLVEHPDGFKRVLFFDESGLLMKWHEGGAFELYVDPWIESVERLAESREPQS